MGTAFRTDSLGGDIPQESGVIESVVSNVVALTRINVFQSRRLLRSGDGRIPAFRKTSPMVEVLSLG